MKSENAFLKSYCSSLILLSAIIIGSILGFVLKDGAEKLKPFGDIFLNLLFTIVVPLVFFSISSAVAGMNDAKRLGKILGVMILIFTVTGIISSLIMIIGVKMYPPAEGIRIALEHTGSPEKTKLSEQLVKALTVTNFSDLLSKKNMLGLIIFSMIVGLAALLSKEKGRPFAQFLTSGNEVMGKGVSLIMLYAPIGLGCYFAYLVGVFGPQLLGSYVRSMILYYPIAIFYFFVCFSAYAYLAGQGKAVKSFWQNIPPASLTALGTGSSVATIPTNLESAKRIGVPEDIREVVIPIGATIHMDGSCLSAILKIALLFGIFHMDFSGAGTIATAIGIALLSGTVMSGIPGGGFLGELMIVTMYGFPPEALPIISMVGTLVDPPATMVNSSGDTVSSMIVARVLNGKKWMES